MRHLGLFAAALFTGCAALSLVQCVGDDTAGGATLVSDSGSDGNGEDGSPGADGSADGGGGDSADASLAPLTIAPTVGMGFGLACAGRSSGRVYCWGQNNVGQLGNLLTSGALTPTPVQVALITTAARVAVGLSSACALLTDHTVWCWGSNSTGQLGHPIVADAPNTYRPTPSQVAGLTDVMEIGSGGGFVCVRKADKSVWCWGDNSSNQLGHSKMSDSGCGGSAVCSATPTQVAGLTADSIAVGFGHVCARVGTSAHCWGDNSKAQLGHVAGQNGDDINNTNPAPTQAIAANVAALFTGGGYVTCMLDQTSTASCWGNGSQGQLGDLGALATSAAPVAIAGLAKTATKVLPSFTNACAIMGTLNGVWCWGDNSYGGNGVAATAALRSAATVPFASTTFVDLAAAKATDSWCAVNAGGDVYCWGVNLNDELGHANTSDGTCSGIKCNTTPTLVANLP